MLSTGGLDERGVRWNPSNSLLSRALIRLRKAGLRNMMRMVELKVRIRSPPAASLQTVGPSRDPQLTSSRRFFARSTGSSWSYARSVRSKLNPMKCCGRRQLYDAEQQLDAVAPPGKINRIKRRTRLRLTT